MPYGYFDNLSARQQKTYLQSDRITEVKLRDARSLKPLAAAVETALATEKPRPVQTALQRLADGLMRDLRVPPLSVKVLARRPSKHGEELHGLYVAVEGQKALITVWMRTSAKKKVVTYRTFLRTFLHEVCHHLDMNLYRLRDTFHTEGFFKRESSLMRSLVPRAAKKKPAKKKSPKKKVPKKRTAARAEEPAQPVSRRTKKQPDPPEAPSDQEQLSLFDS
jgi:hypothetical protein